MTRGSDVHLLRLGMCTPLGLTAATSLAAAHAGIVRFADTDLGEPGGPAVPTSTLARLDPSLPRAGRIAILAERAARDCLAGLEPGFAGPALALYLALPEHDHADVDETTILAELTARTTVPFELRGVVRSGRAGLFELLAHLADPSTTDVPTLALVIAADSRVDAATLQHLARSDRVLADRRDGLIPGEAAAALLLARGPVPAHSSRARLFACTSGQVTDAKDPLHALADGLTDVFARLAADPDVQTTRAALLASAQTGEVAEARAFTYAALRNAAVMPEPLVHVRACDCFGDAGAAAPALALALAVHHLRATSGRALLYASAEHGAIGACVLERSPLAQGADR